MLSAFLQDLRYALRGLASRPGLTAIAVVSIAVGIGVNTAIFSVANALLLRPFPYADAERLVILLLLTSIGFVATYAPARRAARTDPIESLRME